MEVSTDTCELVFWQNALFSKWTIEAELTKLAGEYDLNFFAKCQSGKGFILKVMRTDCPKWLVEVQIQALDHVHKKIENAPIPRFIASSKGAGFELIHDQFGNPRLVWVLEEILGQCYADTTLKTEQLAYAVGVALARLAKALRSFKKKCLYRDFKWNLMQGSWIAEKLTCIEEPNRHTSILRILQEFNEIELDLEDLEQQVIHNDANDYNILIKGTLSEKRDNLKKWPGKAF